MLFVSIPTLPRPLNFASHLQYKRDAVRHACSRNVVQSLNVVLQSRSQKEQFNKLKAKKAPVDNQGRCV